MFGIATAIDGGGDFAIDDERRIELISDAGAMPIDDAKVLLDQLVALGYTLYRKRIFNQPTRRRTSARVTPELAQQVRDYSKLYPDKNQGEIGKVFNINAGRVSECLNGLR